MVPFPVGILLSFFFFLYYSKINKFITTSNNFCAFDASFDLKKDLRSLWNSEPKTWFHFLLVFCCHSFFFSIIPRSTNLLQRLITFAHLTLASIWKKIWEACEILNLKHGSISCWYSVVILFFLYYSKINKFITTAITFAHLTLASIWKRFEKLVKFWTWNMVPFPVGILFVILFFSLLFQDQQIYYNGNITFAHLTLASIWKKIWEACEILNLKHGSISCWYSVVILFFLYYSKINKFITTAIFFAHLTLASIWKKIWEACEILNLKHGSISCWYSVVIFFFSLLFQDKQIYYNG